MTLRSSGTPKPPTPSGGGASPRTPASGRGSKRKSRHGASPKKAGRGLNSTRKKLDDWFNDNDAGSDVQEPSEPAVATGGGPTPLPVRPEPAPDVPPPIWEQLEASDDPLMKLIGAQFRASQAREAALQNQLDRQAQAAADREEVRNFEESGVSKFHFDPDVTKRAIDKFVVPNVYEDSVRQFYSQLQVTPSNQDSVARAFASVVRLTKSSRNKIFQRRLRDSRLSTKPRPLSEAEKTLYSKEQMAKEKVLSQMHEDFSPEIGRAHV